MTDEPKFSFGIIADSQYADIPDFHGMGSDRRFSASLGKLKEAINFFNTKQLAFVVNLGDLIDQDIQNFDAVLPICALSRAPLKHIVGNHDFSGKDYAYKEDRDKVMQKLGLKSFYYSFVNNGLRFVVLDTNEVGVIEWPKNSPK